MIPKRSRLPLVLLLLVASTADAQPSPGGPPPQQLVIPIAPAGTPAHGQITVTSAATLVRAANQNRTTITVVNHGSTNVFVGFTNGVTASTGVFLVGIPGSSLTFQTRTDIWALTASGSQTVSFSEEIR
jgi:hypothetical protein